MNTLFLIVLLTALNITIKCNELKEAKLIIKPHYPKKVKAMQSGIKIFNARKFENLHAFESRKANFEKKNVKKDPYTVFPPIVDKALLDAPEGTYFEDVIVRKPRVKKVLPDYSSTLFRKKRAIHNEMEANDTITERIDQKHRRKIRKHDSKKKLRHKRKSKAKSKNEPDDINARDEKVNPGKEKNVKHGRKRSTVVLKYTRKLNKTGKIHTDDNVRYLNKGKKAKRQREKRHKEIKEINRRLIAGKDAVIQDYPYVVSIQKGNEHWCAGALLNSRLVITTANCVWKARSISRMRIRAGSRYMDRGGQVAKIQEVVKHPGWNIRSHPDNDVALLLLDRNIKFSDSVHGVDLPNRAMWPAFDDVWVTSWGSDRRDGIFQTVGVSLQVYHARLINHDACNNITQRFGVAVTRNFICIAQTGRRAPCTRDTGAPAVSDGILWGLASWGIRKLCGTERFPAMFSYLASRSNLDFITNATHYLMSDKRFYPYPDRFAVNRVETTESPDTTPIF